MPRTARKISKTGIYHVMFRGNNQQQIFEDDEDYNKILFQLKDVQEISHFKLYAYCLMGNHVHFLIEVGNESISQVMKRIACRFVHWYNNKYERTGHLLQDRFHSEVVENDRAFMSVIRYIHQNPVKAGLSKTAAEYPWSSYNIYAGKSSKLVNTSKLTQLVGSIKKILSFLEGPSDDVCLDVPETHRINDTEGKRIIANVTKCTNVSQFQALSLSLRNRFLKQLHKYGLSIRQLSRLCGINKGMIHRIIRE